MTPQDSAIEDPEEMNEFEPRDFYPLEGEQQEVVAEQAITDTPQITSSKLIEYEEEYDANLSEVEEAKDEKEQSPSDDARSAPLSIDLDKPPMMQDENKISTVTPYGEVSEDQVK